MVEASFLAVILTGSVFGFFNFQFSTSKDYSG